MLEKSTCPPLPSALVHDSWGAYLQRTSVSDAGDPQQREDLKSCWFRLNRILPPNDRLFRQLHAACEATQLIDGLPRHDAEISEEDIARIAAIHFLRETPHAVFSVAQELKHINECAARAVTKITGVLRGQKKALLSDRLTRLSDEIEELEALFKAEQAEQAILPRQPYQLRQLILAELVISIEAMLSELTPLRQALHGSSYALGETIRCHEARLFWWRRKIKKLRDNPSQRQTATLLAAKEELTVICRDFAALKDRCFHDCKEFGYAFFDRGGPR